MTPVVALRGPRQVGKTTLIQQIIQHLLDEGVPWAPQLKHLVDMSAVRVMITGSSALKIAKAQDSLAGRVSTIEMGPLFLREIAAFRGWDELPPFLTPFNGLAQLKTQKFWQDLREFGQQYQTIRQSAFTAFSERGAYPIAHLYPDAPWEEMG
ncbi:MAG: AAA family ATPase [Candidatus Parabeggiatoa sp.]|nr:AAA family ATPase [Candidatus Parabeggiatoa sp.]